MVIIRNRSAEKDELGLAVGHFGENLGEFALHAADGDDVVEGDPTGLHAAGSKSGVALDGLILLHLLTDFIARWALRQPTG